MAGNLSGKELVEPPLLDAALGYARKGLRVLPCHGTEGQRCQCKDPNCSSPGKRPWLKDWPTAATTDENQLREWWPSGQTSNIGIATGEDLVVVDIDGPTGMDSLHKLEEQFGSLPPTWAAITGKGEHLYFRSLVDISIKNSVGRLGPGLDVRGKKGYVIAPPSRHINGAVYRWVEGKGPDDLPLAELPPWLTDLLVNPAPAGNTNVNTEETPTLDGFQKGERNDRLFRLARKLHSEGRTERAIRTLVAAENALCEEPLDDKELNTLIESALKYPAKARENSGRPSKSKILMELVDREGFEYFHDEFGKPWVCVGLNGYFENMRVKSTRFRTHLSGLFYSKTGQTAGRETLDQCRDVCTARAVFEGPERALWYRVARQDKKILIDLGWSDWKAIEVSAEGWGLVQPKQPPFRRFSHMKPLPEPERGGRVQDFLTIVPVKERSSQILLCVWLPTLLIPDIQRPGVVLSGLQGSGKTWTSACVRHLVDPSAMATLSLPRNLTELVQALDHHYLPIFDNLSSLPESSSDMLCRAVSGAGYTKRELYSDDDDVCYSFLRPFVLNGISVCATKPDLLDRSLLIELCRIPAEERKSEKSLLKQSTELRPRVFGAMLDALVYAIKYRTELDFIPARLADWCEWAVYVAEAIGIEREEFLTALSRNTAQQHREVNQGDPVAITVLAFMVGRESWQGTPTELYAELSELANSAKLYREDSWPKAANSFTRRLRAISHNLEAEGVRVREDRKGTKGTRTLIIMKERPENRPEISSESSDRQQTNDINAVPSDSRIASGHQATPQPSVEAQDLLSLTISKTERDETVGRVVGDNIPESLPTADTDSSDDSSGQSAGSRLPLSELRIRDLGCRRGCTHFKRTEERTICHQISGDLDLTDPDFVCPKPVAPSQAALPF